MSYREKKLGMMSGVIRSMAGVSFGVLCSSEISAASLNLSDLPRGSQGRAEVDGIVFNVDENTPRDKYSLINGGELNINNGIVEDVLSNNSTVNVNSGTVYGQLELTNSRLVADKLTVENRGGDGVVVARGVGGGTPSDAYIKNSSIVGGGVGASVGGRSLLALDSTKVEGTGETVSEGLFAGAGISIGGADLKAVNGSNVIGKLDGVFITGDPGKPGGSMPSLDASNVLLDSSSIIGRAGAAIKVSKRPNTTPSPTSPSKTTQPSTAATATCWKFWAAAPRTSKSTTAALTAT